MTPRLIVFIVAGLLPTLTLAEPLPQPKPAGPGGSCPHGWVSSGSYCVPSQGAQDAIAKPPNGTCPWGLARVGLVLPAQQQRQALNRRRQIGPGLRAGLFFARVAQPARRQ
jgi:hypothetical protein